MTKENFSFFFLKYSSKDGVYVCVCVYVMTYGTYFILLVFRVTEISELTSFLSFYSGHAHFLTKQEMEEWHTVPQLVKDIFTHSSSSA